MGIWPCDGTSSDGAARIMRLMARSFGLDSRVTALPFMIAALTLGGCGALNTQVHVRNLDSVPYVVRVIDPELAYLALPGSWRGIAVQSSTDLRVRGDVLDAASCSIIGSFDTSAPGALVTIEAGELSFSEDLAQGTTTQLAPTAQCEGS
jgi:hypothetical protein